MQRNLKKRRRKMSIDELIGGADAWFDPSEAKSTPLEEGSYSAQVTDLVIKKDKEVQGKFLADIYEPVFEIKGREVKHKGLFRFKKPDQALYPHLQSDMGSNSGYFAFVKLLDVVEEKDGKMMLPPVTLELLKQYEYKVDVVMEEWTGREGNLMKTARVKNVTSAQKQKVTEDIADDDLPF